MDRSLSAAVIQCFALVALCTAIAYPSWFQVSTSTNGTASSSEIFGVAYVIHLSGNLTQSDPDRILTKNGIILLLLMTVFCYVAVFLGFSAFLLDFLGTKPRRVMGMKIAAILHILTAVACLAVLAVCCWLFILVHRNLQSKHAQAHAEIDFGKSFYIAAIAFFLSVAASTLSICTTTPSYRPSLGAVERTGLTEESSPLLEEDSEDTDRLV
ncbi:transmembrane protein 127 [Latimeria chalumnae]|uniref:Transmembrane protein 127 transmembrane region domain-containing protein n=1 Tax=Latimeria chalumnae TaxID=7897 RepID=H2ZS02_LATCH|nr:PREDICTED: transmembrane protein 127-like [Latimeria chalumnae]|eukprot:XP_006013031.1 PREDICTED: transmembrane protein 127-like [Latimeria chalumnae]